MKNVWHVIYRVSLLAFVCAYSHVLSYVQGYFFGLSFNTLHENTALFNMFLETSHFCIFYITRD